MDRGYVSITLLSENADYQPVDLEDLQEWAGTYGISHPVLQDTSSMAWNYIQTGLEPGVGSYGLPNLQLLSPGMLVEITNGHGEVNTTAIESYLPN